MSYLAMYSSPYEDNNESNIIDKKKAHNKTQKNTNRNENDNEKVNSVIEKLHNMTSEQENDDLGNYYDNPPPATVSIGSERAAITKEGQQVNKNEGFLNFNNKNNTSGFIESGMGIQPFPSDTSNNLDLNNYNKNYYTNGSANEYYKKYIPNFNPSQIQKLAYPYPMSNGVETSSQIHTNSPDTADPMMKKLNYMIHLLEQKQDEKTNNVTEEVVLYSFLGIFIIFVVDSFARVNKYTR
jgi:hypothetical protein